jgi:uncharacterized membrane protein
MQTVINIFILLVIAFAPRAMIKLAEKVKFLRALGPIFLCYAVGLLLSFIIKDTSIAETVSELLLPLAIPMILLSSDLKSVSLLSKKALLSFVLSVISVLVTVSLGFFLLKGNIEFPNKVAGMMAGLYTGGTPNLLSIGYSLGVPDSEIAVANMVDLVTGGIYFLLLISVIPAIVRKILPETGAIYTKDSDKALKYDEAFLMPGEKFSFRSLWRRLPIFFAALVSALAAVGISLLTTGQLNILIIMLIVTTGGVAFSFVRRIHEIPGSFASGQYVIYMFSLAIGLYFDFSMIKTVAFTLMLIFLAVQVGSIFLQVLLAKIFKIGGHLTIITSTACIFGPAFVMPVSNALEDKSIVLPGLISGILGYAIGNYLGIGISFLLGFFT